MIDPIVVADHSFFRMRVVYGLGIVVLLLGAGPSLAVAGQPSGVSAAPYADADGHHVSVGWPSLAYDWWNRGEPDWAIGAELVYGDWSGAHSDVEIGFAANGRFRWRLSGTDPAAIALQLSPGVLMAATEGPADRFVFAVRSEIAVPVTVRLHPRVNLITGGVVPVTVVFVEDADPFVTLPLMGRIGAEITATKAIVSWLMLEIGPGIAFGDGGTDVELAFRVTTGATFW